MNRRVKFLVFSFCFMLVSVAGANNFFSNQLQKQALNKLKDIVRYTHPGVLGATGTGEQLARNMPVIMNRLRETRRSIEALGPDHISPGPAAAHQPFAFIQSATDRRTLLRDIKDLEYLHQQLKLAKSYGNQRDAREFESAIQRKGEMIQRTFHIWGKKLGDIEPEPVERKGICRNLQKGDKYYSDWSRCCDIGNGKSRWWKRSTGKSGDWSGTCKSWGINKAAGTVRETEVCRPLRKGDPYFSKWSKCCDIGNGKSRWWNRSSGQSSNWSKTCKQWGID